MAKNKTNKKQHPTMKQPPLPISFFQKSRMPPRTPGSPQVRKCRHSVLASISLLPVLSPSFIQGALTPRISRLLYTLLGAPYHCQLLFPLILHSSTKHPILGCYSGLKLSYLNRGVKCIVITQGLLTVAAYPKATSSPM